MKKKIALGVARAGARDVLRAPSFEEHRKLAAKKQKLSGVTSSTNARTQASGCRDITTKVSRRKVGCEMHQRIGDPISAKGARKDVRWKRARHQEGVLPPKPAGQMAEQPEGVGEAVGRVPVVGAQHAPDMWFVNGHRPSAGEVKKQMDAMHRRQSPGTPKAARNRMAHAVSKAREAGELVAMRKHDKGVVNMAPPSFKHLVGDGRASLEWRKKILAGKQVPRPFMTEGKAGKCRLLDLGGA